MTLNRRLSILYYTLNDRSKIVHCFFALFIGFQEGFIFGNVLKVEKNQQFEWLIDGRFHLV